MIRVQGIGLSLWELLRIRVWGFGLGVQDLGKALPSKIPRHLRTDMA